MLFCIHHVNQVTSHNDSESRRQHYKHCLGYFLLFIIINIDCYYSYYLRQENGVNGRDNGCMTNLDLISLQSFLVPLVVVVLLVWASIFSNQIGIKFTRNIRQFNAHRLTAWDFHTFNMAATSFHAEKCCYLVSGMQHLPGTYTAESASSQSLVQLYL